MSKRLVLFTCIVIVLGIAAASTSYADERIVVAYDSCRTVMSKPDENDHANRLVVRTTPGDPTRSFKSYVKFDIGGIDTQSLASATLVISLRRDRGACEMDISYVNDDVVENIDWISDDITWKNAPGNDPTSEGLLDPEKTTLIDRPRLEEGLMHDQFMVDALEALQTDTDGIVQFVLHNSSSYLNIVAHDEGEEQHQPFVPALILVQGYSPYDGEIDVPRDAALSWLPGTNAVTYDVYLGTNFSDVNEATRDNPLDVLVSMDQEETTYDPPGFLEFNQKYYWRIDDVNDADPSSPWKGDVWSFTVANFIVVEDFEDYNDFPPDEIWKTWIDGYDDPTNGSSAGYPDPDFVAGEHYVETKIVHKGKQSMPLLYDNSAGLSEVTRTLNADWTQEGVVTLTLFYRGNASNAVVPMYVALDGSVVVTNDSADAVMVTEWTQWDIPLQTFADLGVNLTNVGSISIGFGNKANPVAGGSGVVYFDDIRLYLPEPQ